MALATDIDIDSLTHNHDDPKLRQCWHFLDRLLDRLAPIASIKDAQRPVRELGTLTVLPTELLLDIFEDFSIRDLMRFRHCNRYSDYFVHSFPDLRMVLQVAPNTVKGIIALQVSTHITPKQRCHKLCHKLCQRECDACGSLAQSIYLPKCLRVCNRCLNPPMNWFTYAVTKDELVKEAELQPDQIAARPSFRPLLCTLTNGIDRYKMVERHTLYDDPSEETLLKRMRWSPYWNPQVWLKMMLYPPDLTDQGNTVDSNMLSGSLIQETITVVNGPLHERLRACMAAVTAPWLDPMESKIEQGVYCSACVGSESESKLYTRTGFLVHLSECRVQPASFEMMYWRSPWLFLSGDIDSRSNSSELDG